MNGDYLTFDLQINICSNNEIKLYNIVLGTQIKMIYQSQIPIYLQLKIKILTKNLNLIYIKDVLRPIYRLYGTENYIYILFPF